MTKARVLVVEDEDHIREIVRFNLQEDGYDVEAVASGEEALESIRTSRPDVLVLDLMLPGIDGMEVCKRLRGDSKTRNLPILMLTAKTEDHDVVAGIEGGADDYVTKPFSPTILNARVGNILRRKLGKGNGTGTKPITIRALALDPKNREVLVRGNSISLTATEFRIAYLLASAPGTVFSREELVEQLHGEDGGVTIRSIDVQMVGLRRKLGPIAGRYLETVRGLGYRFRPSRIL